MDNEKITVLVVEPEKKPYAKEIDSGLASLQHEVGGYIQAVYPFESPCAIVCDEEAKLKDSPLNRALRDDEGHIYDVIAGTFLIVGLGEEDFTSLGQKEMEEMSAYFAVPEMFMNVDGRLAVIRIEEDEPESLRSQLYHKMEAEFKQYEDWLCAQPASEILHHTYEYSTKQDILFTFEQFTLSEEQAQALLNLPTPLDDIFRCYEKTETDLMEALHNCMESRADALLSEADQPSAQDIPPMYFESAPYAIRHDEADAYGRSYQANVACRRAIEETIIEHYRDNRLDVTCAKAIIDTFGMERVKTVLASTIQAAEWDGRYSDGNKKWAKSIPIPDEVGRDYHINGCHRGLTDLFCTEVRRLQQEVEKKPSVLGKLADTIPSPHKEKSLKTGDRER